jgi:hypothetical protein
VTTAADVIAAYFDSYGWNYVRQEASVYRTAFTGETGRYDIWLKVTDHWVYFSINPYVPKPEGQPHGEGTLQVVLRANHEVNLAKFAVDDDGDVLLSVELPAEGFCYTHFCDALTALAHYADGYRDRVDAAIAADRAEVV